MNSKKYSGLKSKKLKLHSHLKWSSYFIFVLVAGGVQHGILQQKAFGQDNPIGGVGEVFGKPMFIGSGGAIHEIDAFLYIDGIDLNGDFPGVTGKLSRDLMPEGIKITFDLKWLEEGSSILFEYVIKNSGTIPYQDLRFFSFFDGELNQEINTFFNEYGWFEGSPGRGYIDNLPEYWMIGEPGYVTDGKIIESLQKGILENINLIPNEEALLDDVSMALGFDLGDLHSGENKFISILISSSDDKFNGLFLSQTDNDHDLAEVLTFSGESSITEDKIPPILPDLPPSEDLGCNPTAIPNSILDLIAWDNFDGAISVDCVVGNVQGDNCFKYQDFLYSATDSSGNTSSGTVVYSWKEDRVPPVLPELPAEVNLGCNPETPPKGNGGLVASDNCDGFIDVAFSEGEIFIENCTRRQIITYTATDSCGNKGSTSVAYTWKEDRVSPVMPELPQGGELGCNPEIPSLDTELQNLFAIDNCDGLIEVNYSVGEIEENGCHRKLMYVFSATDSCGNTESKIVEYTWKEDNISPVLPELPSGEDLGTNPPQLPTGVNGLTAWDQCDGEIPVNWTANEILENEFERQQTFTYYAEDECGNVASRDVTYYWEVHSEEFADVSEFIDYDIQWRLDYRTGLLMGTISIVNPEISKITISQKLHLAFNSSTDQRLWSPDGTDDNGIHFVDLSIAFVSAIQQVGNKDKVLDPGESILVGEFEFYSLRRTPPQKELFELRSNLK